MELLWGVNDYSLYRFPFSPTQVFIAESVPFDVWHSRLGYPHRHTVQKILKENNFPFSASNKDVKCSFCLLGKLARIPLALVDHTSTSPFEIIRSDV